MSITFLKPNPENKLEGEIINVRDPIKGDWLPMTGRGVSLTMYWLNRLRHGEVIRCTQHIPEKKLSEKLFELTKAQLQQYALEKLKLTLDKNSNKQAMIDMIVAETDLQLGAPPPGSNPDADESENDTNKETGGDNEKPSSDADEFENNNKPDLK